MKKILLFDDNLGRNDVRNARKMLSLFLIIIIIIKRRRRKKERKIFTLDRERVFLARYNRARSGKDLLSVCSSPGKL